MWVYYGHYMQGVCTYMAQSNQSFLDIMVKSWYGSWNDILEPYGDAFFLHMLFYLFDAIFAKVKY